MIDQIKKLLQNKWIYILFCITAILIISPRCFIQDTVGLHDVDGGWVWALDFFVAHKGHYSWGKDIIYTFGPLGVFSTRCCPANYWLWQFVFDIYVAANIFVIAKAIKSIYSNATGYLFLIAIMASMWETNLLLEICSLLLLLCLYHKDNFKLAAYLIVINTSLLMYAKLNTLLFSVFLIISLVIILLNKKMFYTSVAGLVLFLLLNIFFVSFFNLSFVEYFHTSFQTIKYYTYAMYYPYHSGKKIFYGCVFFVGSICLITVYLTYKNFRSSNWFNILLIANVFLLHFILFKQGFTRADNPHLGQYFSFLPLLLFCFYTIEKKTILPIIYFIIGSVCFSLYFTLYVYKLEHRFYTGETAAFPFISYAKGLLHSARKENDEKDVAGNGSIDFMSDQCINMAYKNNSNWHNRPAFQSIASVSSSLDSINAAYYNSAQAPDTVFYSNEIVDNRNPLWEEPRAMWTVFTNYQYVYTDSLHELVLAKRNKNLALSQSLVMDTVIHLNDSLTIPATVKGLLVMNASVVYNWKGSLLASLYQPPAILVKLATKDYGLQTVRYIAPIHNNENIIINRFVVSGDYAGMSYFIQNINNYDPNVKSFKFFSNLVSFVSPEISVKIYKVTVN